MTSLPTTEELKLVVTIVRTGSVGSAARELQISQPSASQRLARLERRCGALLFKRDNLGARPTNAGLEMARQAGHILDHLNRVFTDVRTTSAQRSLVVGTFPSLAASLFPVLDEGMDDVAIEQRVEHGDRLVEWVGEGTMDAAFIAIATQSTLPKGVKVHRVGEDELVLFLPAGVRKPRADRHPLRGLSVPYSTYDRGGEQLHDRLTGLGARPRLGVTMPTTLAMARRRGDPAVVPRSAVANALLPQERITELPFTTRLRLSMLTGPAPDRRLTSALPWIRSELSLLG